MLTRRLTCLLAALMTLLLAGCGGTEDVGDSSGPSWITQGQVLNTAGQPVSGATVAVLLNNARYATSTGADGGFKLSIPRSADFPRYFAGSVSKEGLIPQPLLFTYENGQLFTSSTSFKLAVKTDADVVVQESYVPHHLGDDSYGGAANSQLQVPTQGLSYIVDLGIRPDQVAAYRTLTVSVLMRGVQTDYVSGTFPNPVLKLCNSIFLSPAVPGEELIGPNHQFIPSTDSAGGWTRLTFIYDLRRMGNVATTPVRLGIFSGRKGCFDTSGDADDFEFILITGRLQ